MIHDLNNSISEMQNEIDYLTEEMHDLQQRINEMDNMTLEIVP